MNVQEYISSGLIESYVLGISDEKESADFERMCSKFPEINEARIAFELLLEEYAREHAIQPPRHLKSRIFAHIEIESEKKQGIVHHQGGPINLHPKINWLRYLAAAVIILLLVSTALNFFFVHRYNKYSLRYRQLTSGNKKLREKSRMLDEKLKHYQVAFHVLKDPQVKTIELKPVPAGPSRQSAATVYWSNSQKDVFLLVHQIPPPAKNKQYQLWAIIHGKLVDAGIFDIPSHDGPIRLKKIESAEGFAVTLEDKGGSTTPTMNQVYIAGNITG